MVIPLALLLALPGLRGPNQLAVEGPRLKAILEVYRQGVQELGYANGKMMSRVRSSDRDAELETWLNGAFDIKSGDREEIFWKDPRVPQFTFQRGAAVIGWMGNTPIVRTPHGNSVPDKSGLRPLRKLLSGAIDVYDLGGEGRLVVRPFIANGSDYVEKGTYFVVKGGVSTPFHGIGEGRAEFQTWGKGILAVNDTQTDGDDLRHPSYGDIWIIGPGGSSVKRIFHLAGVTWNLGEATPSGGILVTALRFDGKSKKFHDSSSLYKLSPNGILSRIIAVRGEWTFYGFDRTKKWVIGTRWQGWEMGAYDLMAINIKTGKEDKIQEAVSNCRLLRAP